MECAIQLVPIDFDVTGVPTVKPYTHLFRILGFLSLAIAAPALAGPSAANVHASRQAGTKLIDIYYDLSGGAPPVWVAVKVSNDGGASYTVPAASLTGDVGAAVAPGSHRHIVWDAGTDWSGNYSPAMRVKVIPSEGGAPAADFGFETDEGWVLGKDDPAALLSAGYSTEWASQGSHCYRFYRDTGFMSPGWIEITKTGVNLSNVTGLKFDCCDTGIDGLIIQFKIDTTIVGTWTNNGWPDGVGSDWGHTADTRNIALAFSGSAGLHNFSIRVLDDNSYLPVDPKVYRIDNIRFTVNGSAESNTLALDLRTGPPASLFPSQYYWSNFAGTPGTEGAYDWIGSAALFHSPAGIAVDANGTLYVTEVENHTIRQIAPWSGAVDTVAGSPGTPGADDGMGFITARFRNPRGIAADPNGTLYVADSGNHTIRQIDPDNTVSSLAGHAGTSGTDNGTRSTAYFDTPSGVAVDSGSNVFVADAGNHAIRKIAPDGTVTAFAGIPGLSGTDDGTGSAARFYNPTALAVDSVGNLYVADTGNHTIRFISRDGAVITLAGQPGVSGSADGAGTAAQFFQPGGVAVDAYGTVYVADSGNQTVRKIALSGSVTTLGGMAGQSGWVDGVGTTTPSLNLPMGIAVDNQGSLYVADDGNDRIALGAVYGTGAAIDSGTGPVTLGGIATPNGLPASVYFRYGMDDVSSEATGSIPIGSGTDFSAITMPFADFESDSDYFYQLVYVNANWTIYGGVESFHTGQQFIPKGVTTVPAATSKDPATGAAGAVFSKFESYSLNSSGSTAVLATVAGAGVTSANNKGIWTTGTHGSALLARTNQKAPGGAGAAFSSFGNPQFDDRNHVAFVGGLRGPAGMESGVWSNVNGRVDLLAKSGGKAPGVSEAKFATLFRTMLPSHGKLMFVGSMKAGPGGVTSSNNLGLWMGNTQATYNDGTQSVDEAKCRQ